MACVGLPTVRIVICVNLRDMYGATCYQRTDFSEIFKRAGNWLKGKNCTKNDRKLRQKK